jgi:membrane protein implicated in regulation of membrane protease activity
MLTHQSRVLMIVAVIGGTLFSTWLVAAITDHALPSSSLRYVTLIMFVGIVVICSSALSRFFAMAMREWGQHLDQNSDLIAVGGHDRILIRRARKNGKMDEFDMREAVTPISRRWPGLCRGRTQIACPFQRSL